MVSHVLTRIPLCTIKCQRTTEVVPIHFPVVSARLNNIVPYFWFFILKRIVYSLNTLPEVPLYLLYSNLSQERVILKKKDTAVDDRISLTRTSLSLQVFIWQAFLFGSAYDIVYEYFILRTTKRVFFLEKCSFSKTHVGGNLARKKKRAQKSVKKLRSLWHFEKLTVQWRDY